MYLLAQISLKDIKKGFLFPFHSSLTCKHYDSNLKDKEKQFNFKLKINLNPAYS